MPAAARGHVNCSARRRALMRRSASGLLMIDDTACAIARGSLSAVAPLSVVRISASADVRDTTAGVPQASASSAASPKVSCGPGASATSADARMVATVSRQPTYPVNSTGKPGGLALQPRPHRTLPDHDEPRVDARMPQRANGVDAPVGVLLHRQTPAVHEEHLFAPRPALPHLFRVAARVKLIEVDTQRHGQHIRCADPVELRTGERGRAHHRVVVGCGPPVCEIRDAAGDATGKYLARQDDPAVRARSSP